MQCTDKMTIKAVVLLLVLQGTVAIDLQIEGEQHLDDFRARKCHCLFENLCGRRLITNQSAIFKLPLDSPLRMVVFIA